MALLLLTLGMACAVAATSFPSAAATIRAVPALPNLLVVLLDDMTERMLHQMPRTEALVHARGVEFRNALPEDNLCAPSRATLLAGRYSHNTHIDTLESKERMAELAPTSLAKLLQDRGYRTGLFGKYTNGYLWTDPVPLGWTRWVVLANLSQTTSELQRKSDPFLNVDGHPEARVGWSAEIVGAEALEFIHGPAPWFALYAPTEPHTPHSWPSRHNNLFVGAMAPRDARFNEADVGDKPPALRLPLLTTADINLIDWRWRGALRSLQRVDEQISQLVSAAGPNTYVVLTSDNGFFYGQHRRPADKTVFYRAGTSIPFVVLGPGLLRSVRTSLVTHADLMPTLLELAGVAMPTYADGRSLVHLLANPSASWRHAVPQHYSNPDRDGPAQGVRTDRYTYARYASGAEELYDLQVDPLQLQNRVGRAAYAERKQQLHQLMEDLRACAGAVCRSVDARVVN